MKELGCKKFKISASILVLIFCSFISNAQSIKGKVVDNTTQESLIGAAVKINGTKFIAYVGLDGTYKFNKIPAGIYELSVVYSGYKNSTAEKSIRIVGNETKKVDFILSPDTFELKNITISSDRGNDKGARAIEKNANQLLNVLSAKTIQLLPDITVANALQRVSGVTIEKNSSGEARYPIIRGMEKRYINTLVNGIKIPSPDNKSRFIPLDLFPSELLERLEVSKTLTPSMEGDAIGGTINLVMKDAPEKELLNINFSGGYNNIFDKQDYLKFNTGSINSKSPAELKGASYTATEADFSKEPLKYSKNTAPINSTIGITYGNRFGKSKKFGIVVSTSYQDQFKGTNSFLFTPTTSPNINNTPQFETLRQRQYSSESKRLGFTSKLDYKINSKNNISLFTTYVKMNDYQVRQSIDTTAAINQTLSYESRSTVQNQSIFNATLQGIHKLSPNLTFDWSGVYSVANNAIPDQTTFSHGGLSVGSSTTGGTATLSGPDILSTMSRIWMRNEDKDIALYYNLTQKTHLLNKDLELKIGGLYRNKARINFYNSYTLNPLLSNTGGNQLFTTIDATVFTFKGLSGSPQLNGNNYTFNEDIADSYIQGKWELSNKIELLGGFRVESTLQKYNTELPLTTAAKYGTISYVDVLPSGQLKYQISNSQAFRLSYYKALTRPQFSELIPDGPDDYEIFKQIGNPANLKHSISNNYDLRYELFPGSTDQILLGAFYKDIQDPIELAVVKVGYNSQNFQPINIGKATNYGLEAVVVKYIRSFGISANYTYTQSKVTNDNMLYKYYDPILRITDKVVSETRPLQGQANHVGNLSLMYKNAKIGFDAQIAYVYTGERLSILNAYSGLHYYIQPTQQMDVSFQKRIAKNFSFYGKINNLTNTPIITSIHQSYLDYLSLSGSRAIGNQTDPNNKIIVQKDYYKTSFNFGFRYKL